MESNKTINLINFYDYALAASRTLNKKETQSDDVGHYGFGVSTEYFELMDALEANNKVNISEECADACWYLANHLLSVYEKNDQIWEQVNEIFWKPQYSIILPMEEVRFYRNFVRDYSDVCKKEFAYLRKIDGYEHKMKKMIMDLFKSLVSIMLNSGDINPRQALHNNIMKLYDRYPDKFDSYFAMKRDLVKELETLKTNM